MSEVPEVFDVFEKKLAQVLSFTLVTHPNSTKKAVEELLTYFSSVVERASKAESRIAELELGLNNQTVHSNTLQKILTEKLDRIAELEAERLELRKTLGWAYDLDEYKDNPEEREK